MTREYHPARKSTRVSKKRRRIMRNLFQRLLGLLLIAGTLGLLWYATNSTEAIDQDATAVFLTFPVGLAALFSKSVWI